MCLFRENNWMFHLKIAPVSLVLASKWLGESE